MADAARWAYEASKHKERWETTAGPFAWVKNRILESGLLPFGGFDPSAEPVVTAVLHVGFLSLPETREMLDRLMFDPERSKDSTARSRFGKTVHVHAVSPIDATASRVSGGDQ
jgi:hypothetical protein